MNPQPKRPPLTEAQKQQMRDDVRYRAGYSCEICHAFCLKSGHVHHVDTRGAHGDAAWEMSNMILLCESDHDRAHRGLISKDELRGAI